MQTAVLQPGSHLCLVYENELQHRSFVTRFLVEGVELAQRIIYVHVEHGTEQILAYFEEAGINAQALLRSGQLIFQPASKAYYPRGRFHPGEIVAAVRSAARFAVASGFNGLRVTGEAGSYEHNPFGDQLIEYEAQINALVSEQPVTILCQYNRTSFSPEMLQDVLLTHPKVVVGTEVMENFYYLPPAALIGQDRTAARVNQWINNLASRHAMQNQLQEAMQSLSLRVETQSQHLDRTNQRLNLEMQQRRGAETALVAVNAALIETESRYKTIFDNASDAIVITNLDGVVVEVNQIACERLGYTRGELAGLLLEKFVTPDQVARVAAWVAVVREAGKGSIEVRFAARSGEHILVELNASRISFAGAPAILYIARDVTVRRRMESDLLQSESKFRSLVEQSPMGVALTDENGLVIEWNACAQELYGMPQERVLGRPIWQVRLDTVPEHLRTPELAQEMERSYQEFFNTGQAHWLYRADEREIFRPDGRVVYAQRIRFPIQTGSGFMLASLMQDVTEQHLAERELMQYRQRLEAMVSQRTQELQQRSVELHDSEERYRQLVNKSPVALFVVQNGQFIFANPACVRSFGCGDASALEGLPYESHLTAETAQKIAVRMQRLENGFDNPPVVMSFKRRNGEVFLMEVSSVPIVYNDQPAGLIIGQDITERVRYEQQLEASLAEKEVMLREIHHRVKNNLNVIIALIDLQMAAQQDLDVQQAFRELQMRAQTMSLVHESLYRAPNLAYIDFSGYLRTLVANLAAAYSLAGAAVDAQVEADAVSLRVESAIPCGLIVNELVTNALKYAFPPDRPRADEPPTVVVGLARTSADAGCDQVVLSVRDNGIGLPAGTQLGAPATLGLQLVQVLARQLGAQLHVETEHGFVWHLVFQEK